MVWAIDLVRYQRTLLRPGAVSPQGRRVWLAGHRGLHSTFQIKTPARYPTAGRGPEIGTDRFAVSSSTRPRLRLAAVAAHTSEQ
jgi:hypothetical protein